MTSSELALLTLVSRGRRVIECGALVGGSTVPLAKVASHVLSIDKHEGYGPSTLRTFHRNIDQVRSRVTPLIADVKTVLTAQEGEVMLVDLLGTYDLTKWCLDHAPFGVKVVAIHDTQRPFCEGVDRAIRASMRSWTPFAQADTLTLLRRT